MASSAVTAVAVGVLVAALVSPDTTAGSGTTAATTTATPSAPVPAAAPATTATPVPTSTAPPPPAREISARDWQKIARDPDSRTGDSIVVHGHVTQFDSGTGLDHFRANVDGVEHGRWYDYPTNTILAGDRVMLADLVRGDLFRAEVVVASSYTYSNTMGGSTTAPVLTITKITRTGSAG